MLRLDLGSKLVLANDPRLVLRDDDKPAGRSCLDLFDQEVELGF